MAAAPPTAKDIFLAALEIPEAAERAAFLDKSCSGDDALRQRVEDLLRAYGQPDGPLDKLAAALAPTQLGETIREQPGAVIGPYKLMEQIGEGGFGLVFVAEQQQPIRRKVALKIIKPGMDTRDVIARFKAEQQALALMDHPNIARVFDAGTTESGRPYFVMELVRGIPITEYCDQAQLTPRERLELFVPICNAIQHAHTKGIIHRDVKPSNVLVTLHDGNPVVKVIDFGVAKALHQSLTDRTIYTRFAQMIGTPLYMSPEQAEMSGLDIDTRTDVYSLGVLLYELLTGTTPFDKQRLARAAYDELRRIIREEEPPKPSVRLSQSTDSLPSIAAQRKTEPAKLSKLVHGDLDWIAMKSLEKDRTRRYETANAFAADVLRYLNDEPVEASPPSTVYRLRKFGRKHRTALVTAASFAGLLIAGLIASTWLAILANRARQAAIEAERAAVGSEEKAKDALKQVTQERDAKEAERDRAERQLANGLLRPIGFGQTSPSTGNEEMGAAELRSFVDWSSIKDSRLKSRVLQIAFENPETALRVTRRADRVIQACVGLSPTRRAQAITFLSAKQHDRAADPAIRVAAYWLALELGSADPSMWSESCSYLGDPKNNSVDRFGELVTFATGRIGQLDPEPLIGVLETSTNDEVQDGVCSALGQLLVRMKAQQIKRAGNVVLTTLESSNGNAWTRKELIEGLIVMVPRLESAEELRAQNLLLDLIRDSRTSNHAIRLWTALAPRMRSEAHRRAWEALVSASKNERLSLASQSEALLLRALATRLTAVEAERVWDVLLATAQKPENQDAYDDACEAMMALLPRMSPAQARGASGVFIAMLEKFPVSSARGLEALAPKFEPAEAERAWDALLRPTITWIRELRWDESNPVESNARALSEIAPRLPAARIDHAYHAVVATLQQPNHYYKEVAIHALEALSPRLDPPTAKGAWELLLALPSWSTAHSNDDRSGAFASLAQRLQPLQVSAAAQNLIANPELASVAHIQALTGLADRMEPANSAQAANLLIAFGGDSKRSDVVAAVKDALIALGPRLDGVHAKRAWETMMTHTNNLYHGKPFGFRTLAPRLDDGQVENVQDEVIAALVRGTNDQARYAAIDALIALAPRMGSGRAARAGDALIAALKDSADIQDWNMAVNGTLALAGRQGFPAQDRISATAMAALLDLSSSNSELQLQPKVVPVVLGLRPRALASMLSHPGCVGQLRDYLLERLDEVVFEDGRPVFLKPETVKKPGPMESVPTRRFHNLHEAATWIQKNWPDFDLETNYPATWRGAS